jgi:hypothetical protein
LGMSVSSEMRVVTRSRISWSVVAMAVVLPVVVVG